MTKKHFIFFADLIKRHNLLDREPDLVKEMINYFKDENSLFKKDVFLKACGSNSDYMERQIANAKLIAAAPELLRACEIALGSSALLEPGYAEDYEYIKAAIKKATT